MEDKYEQIQKKKKQLLEESIEPEQHGYVGLNILSSFDFIDRI